MTSSTRDDGFHEIQLNGKQLVFLFMAATVVSVVIFLCGVLVGRGVRITGGSVTEAATPEVREVPGGPIQPAAAVPQAEPADVATLPVPDELSYVKRLEEAKPAPEQLKPAATATARAPAPPPAPEESAAAPPAPQHPPPPAVDEPGPSRATSVVGRGWTVQIAALNERGEADAMVRRLTGKGYEAYVLPPAGGTPSVFRVRVGSFSSRREAESLAVRLQKEEQFKPWVTR